MKNAVKNGKKLILMDPRRTSMARHATHVLQFNASTDVSAEFDSARYHREWLGG